METRWSHEEEASYHPLLISPQKKLSLRTISLMWLSTTFHRHAQPPWHSSACRHSHVGDDIREEKEKKKKLTSCSCRPPLCCFCFCFSLSSITNDSAWIFISLSFKDGQKLSLDIVALFFIHKTEDHMFTSSGQLQNGVADIAVLQCSALSSKLYCRTVDVREVWSYDVSKAYLFFSHWFPCFWKFFFP